MPKEDAMLEPLAGRLKWERTGDGIRAVIPARLDRQVMGALFLRGCAMIGAILAFASSKSHLLEDVLSVFVGLFIGAVPQRLFGRTILSLTPRQMTLTWRALIWWPKERLFSTVSLHNLRFAAKSGAYRPLNEVGQNEMQFDEDRETRSFAGGISRDEACALIAKMMEVYPFPQYLPAESSTGAETKEQGALP